MLIDAPPTLLNTIIHKKRLSHFMAKTMNELAHKSPLILIAVNWLTSGFVYVTLPLNRLTRRVQTMRKKI